MGGGLAISCYKKLYLNHTCVLGIVHHEGTTFYYVNEMQHGHTVIKREKQTQLWYFPTLLLKHVDQ